MNEQQRAELERIRDVLYPATGLEDYDEEIIGNALKSIKALLAQDALDKMAENAREIGLNYDTPLSAFVRSSDEDKAEVMERVIDKAIEAQKEKIGCVNHDCDQCKAVQEPLGYIASMAANDLRASIYRDVTVYGEDLEDTVAIYTTPPAAQPAVQEGRDWSLLEATQESLREHMAEIKRLKAAQPAPVQEPVAEVKAKMTGGNVGIATVIHEVYSPHREPLQPGDKLYAGHRWMGWDIEQVWSERIFGIDMRFENVQDAIKFRAKLDEATTPPAAQKQWVGLSEEEVEAYDDWADFQVGCGRQTLFDMVRNIEAKLKEKNHA
jgi:hypothetical protein